MNRAMFSGVAGMKAHQIKMDVIGNNISNVNTYGYKSQRAVFSDIYYQTLRGASSGTATRGGQNPSMIGYGSALLGIQSQMSQTGSQNTGFGMDVTIAGEGYFQVMDSDGNVFYTRAGMLDYDSNGYLTDINGNFVLGSTGADGQPGSQKIKLDNVGAVAPKAPSITQDINGVSYTITSSNSTSAGNVSITIRSGENLPIGQKAQATISNSSIDILLNSKETFANMDEMNAIINQAITDANGGKQHVAGTFSITSNPASNWSNLTGAQIAGVNFGYDKGTIGLPADGIFGGFKLDSVGNEFGIAAGKDLTYSLSREHTAEGDVFTITATDGTKTYTGTISQSQMATAGKVVMKNGTSSTDVITMTYPSYTAVMNSAALDANTKWENYVPKADAGASIGDQINTLIKDFKNGKVFGGFAANIPADAFGAAPAAVPNVELLYNATGADAGKFTLSIGDYKGTFTKNDCGTEITLTDAVTGKTMQAKVPSYTDMLSSADGSEIGGGNMGFGGAYTVIADKVVGSKPSKDLGFGNATFTLKDGTTGGTITLDQLTSISIGADGTVTVSHPEKGTIVAGRITLASFANPSGLSQEGNNYFSATSNSGLPQLAEAGSGGTGGLKSSMLEMSNVDLSQEFADMITTQRGYQANSRIITVSDTMLEELINLKR